MIKVLFVCYGNICRSTMAEMVFKDMVRKKGLESCFYIDSAGTSDEEAKFHSGIYPKTKEVLKKNNITFDEHYARQMTEEDYKNFDYIICMEKYNIFGVERIIGQDRQNKIYRLLDFTNDPGDISDPWYHRDFDKTYKEVVLGCECLLTKLMTEIK